MLNFIYSFNMCKYGTNSHLYNYSLIINTKYIYELDLKSVQMAVWPIPVDPTTLYPIFSS